MRSDLKLDSTILAVPKPHLAVLFITAEAWYVLVLGLLLLHILTDSVRLKLLHSSGRP
jgi:ATP/ADP translocase